MSQVVPSPSAHQEGDRKREALDLFAPLPRHYDTVAAVLSFGQDPRWRRTMVAAVRAAPGERVLDVATGTGLVAQALVREYGCKVVGLDQSPQMLARARERVAADARLRERVTLVRGEAERLPFADGEFDHLTFTYLLRYVEDPAATLAELARVVKPGGRIASLEFAVPGRPMWRAAWRLYTRALLPVLGRAVSREWSYTGRFLAHSIPDFYERHPLARVLEMWRAAGIEDVTALPMSLGGGVVIWGERAGGRRRPAVSARMAGGREQITREQAAQAGRGEKAAESEEDARNERTDQTAASVDERAADGGAVDARAIDQGAGRGDAR
jgi:demethylmenaquinone methyltransferase/2-methoxy-6-polyprenyl-1,4-benzoquinol methylase